MKKQEINETTKERYELLSKLCLNNWHYINHKVLEFHRDINFFTGHSGSGKSTVIDALQLLLYANTDGRSFFNKAASDESDRSLIEYLRGMTNMEDNNRSCYLRNRDFSSTIVLQMDCSDTGESQCIGVVFDVETATNRISRQFFWHKGPLLEHLYRTNDRTMSIDEIKHYLHRYMEKEDYFCSGTNERFRKNLYDVYLGGLDAEKFPILFKRAISFRMDMKIEDFVKEFICMEQDIHIEDMQESVLEYGRMRKKIQDTKEELLYLEKIEKRQSTCDELKQQQEACDYYIRRLQLLALQTQIDVMEQKIQISLTDRKQKLAAKEETQQMLQTLEKRNEELLRQIAASGFEECRQQLNSVRKLRKHLEKSREKWQETAKRLTLWEGQISFTEQEKNDLQAFADGSISKEQLCELKQTLETAKRKLEGEIAEVNGTIRDLNKQEKLCKEELAPLKAGKKSYPKELEEARQILQTALCEQEQKPVRVEILADLLDIQNEEWRNAIEGYLGNNKLALVVEPAFAKQALSLYHKMDKKKYFRVALLDTENLMQQSPRVQQNALAEEVTAKEPYVQQYIAYTLGAVIKCDTMEELRRQHTGITRDCMLYKGFRLQHMNPDQYTRYACIGEAGQKKRMQELEQNIAEIREQKKPLSDRKKEYETQLSGEFLSMPADEYLQMKADCAEAQRQKAEEESLELRLKEIAAKDVSAWEAEQKEIEEKIQNKREELKKQEQQIWSTERWINDSEQNLTQLKQQWDQEDDALEKQSEFEKELEAVLQEEKKCRYETLVVRYQKKIVQIQEKLDGETVRLREEKAEYLRAYPNRPFSTEEKDAPRFAKLYETLRCDDLESYQKAAGEQAKTAVEHFKEDFIYKIRSAIREAMDRQEELNQVLAKMDFGKDKYRFVISKNKGLDGKYYDMFMDDSLEVNPSDLNCGMEHQMDFFTMEHENQYGDLMNELISIFIPPENAGPEELEEARRNMEKYADYRTYLSFEMQQIIKGDETIHINLSRMIRKNSGGEGQNPQYVALLASFAQMYRMNQNVKSRRNPTIRLVVLDEAFSKMDAEKVAGCIRLIRGLGFQAIICATNDKIQNYLENVDKTFVFANPDKKCISIQEFERRDFADLEEEG
ncbi:MAG: ATP-binding protein [Lachnospiraceae bacterium]